MKGAVKNLLIALWLCFLAFPLAGLQADSGGQTWAIRWGNLGLIFFLGLAGSSLWRWLLQRRQQPPGVRWEWGSRAAGLLSNREFLLLLLVLMAVGPLVLGSYQTNILITAMMYVILGLGLNLVVGLAGLLDLGYVAFYALGAYSYALGYHNFGWGFWQVLLLGGGLAALMGVLLGFPVLRLRGDYLAIVTLGFGEILRLVLENEAEITHGPQGIGNLPKPGLWGVEWDYAGGIRFLFYVTLGLLLLAMLVTRRLQQSRLGRAWMAIRENEPAAQAMGINLTRTKLWAFGLGAFWAGLVGVVFAAKASFVNPASFQFHESAIILSIVVLGGMGSIQGVVLAALVLVLLPEHLRFLAEYRMLIFGAILVVMMVFCPQGLLPRSQPDYRDDHG